MEVIYMSHHPLHDRGSDSLLRSDNMRLEHKDYTIDSFLEEIALNADEIFGKTAERKWLKTYVMYAKHDWFRFFEKLNPEKNGVFYYLSIPNVREDNKPS